MKSRGHTVVKRHAAVSASDGYCLRWPAPHGEASAYSRHPSLSASPGPGRDERNLLVLKINTETPVPLPPRAFEDQPKAKVIGGILKRKVVTVPSFLQPEDSGGRSGEVRLSLVLRNREGTWRVPQRASAFQRHPRCGDPGPGLAGIRRQSGKVAGILTLISCLNHITPSSMRFVLPTSLRFARRPFHPFICPGRPALGWATLGIRCASFGALIYARASRWLRVKLSVSLSALCRWRGD